MDTYRRSYDYDRFLKIMTEAQERFPLRLLAYALMPNHFHLVIWPDEGELLSRWMQWVTSSYARYHHLEHGTSGHLWQGRYKAFPIQNDEHLVCVLRYVHANPVQAGLVARAPDWPYSSVGSNRRQDLPRLNAGPLASSADRPLDLFEPLPEAEVSRLRRHVARDAPFGDPGWMERTCSDLSLVHVDSRAGRPLRRFNPELPTAAE